jgi:anti-sigma factor RsiW
VPRPDLQDEELMRYLDGELSVKEARLVEKRIAGSAEVRLQVEALSQLREVLRSRYQVAEVEAAPRLDGLWAKLTAQLDHSSPAPAPAMVAPARTVSGATARPSSGLLATLREWFDAYRGHVLTGAVGAVAGALIAVLVLRGLAPGGGPGRGAAGGQKAEVESLEVPNGTGTVFQVAAPDGKGAATTVIWVNQQPENASEGPI